MRGETVAVVGAGVAGLAAAAELQGCGLNVTLLESQSRPGGRARVARREGFALEALPPLISTRSAAFTAWIAAVGAGEALLPLRPVVTVQVRGGRTSPVDPRRLVDFARVPGLRPHQALRLMRLPRLMRRYRERLDPAHPESGAPLDDRSVADFGRLYFGQSVLDRWMAPFVTADTLADEQDASRVLFLRRWSERHGALAGLPRAPLADLCEAAADKLPVLLGANVRSLEPGRDGGIDLSYEREGRERVLQASAVVLAVPAPEAARLGGALLTTGEREVVEGISYAPAVSLWLAAVRPFFGQPRQIRVPHAEGSLLESVLLEPGLPGGRVPDGFGSAALLATASYGQRALDLPDETVEKELLDAFERFEPRGRARVHFTHVLRLPRGRPRFEVGSYRGLARLARVEAARLAEGGRLVLAGDYRMDPSWEGAFASGQRAARTLAASLD